MPRLIREFLCILNISHVQLAPNSWRTIIGMMIVLFASSQGEGLLTMEEIMYCYRPYQGEKMGYWYLMARDVNRIIVEELLSSYKIWKKSFLLRLYKMLRHPA